MKIIGRSRALIHLDLSSNQLTHKGAKKVFKALLYNPSLISLALGSVDNISKNKIGPKGVKHLVNLLQNSKQLEFLDIRGSLLTDSGLISLCEGLKGNTYIHYLNISKNEITAYGAQKLSETLKKMQLIDLDISCNPLGTSGIKEIAMYINNNSCTLEKLDVSECKI